MVTIENVREAVQALNLSGQPLCVHASLRSFGWVEDGASTVIEGLLSEHCTIMVPTFSYFFAVSPPVEMRPERNGCRYEPFSEQTPGIGRIYSPDSVEISRGDMGAIPAAIVEMPQRLRGNHPLNSFSAVGPLAQELIADQTPSDVYAPLITLTEAGGSIVMMGVGLERMTFLHLAEHQAGRNLFIRWANDPDGQPMAVTVGSCSKGFGKLEPMLAPIIEERKVGHSTWRVFPAKAVLEVAARAVWENPEITHCGDPECIRCNDALKGGPILPGNIYKKVGPSDR
jgi:aminoglycoside N3'-acetyltransferase